MNTHVFIVDKTTFNIHLSYLFAGTGAKDNVVDFNEQADTFLSTNTENMLVDMISDIGRVRKDDFVIFYLQQNFEQRIFEGKFYGVFKVRKCGFLDNLRHLQNNLSELQREYSFVYPKKFPKFRIHGKTTLLKTALTAKEENKLLRKFDSEHDQNIIASFIEDFYNDNQYLLKAMGKSLTFRILIEPYTVYSKGVTEWEALDEIRNIHSPNQMLWSLIYRKLKGNRGNTMITIYEAEKLCQLIRNKNNGTVLNIQNNLLCFNADKQEVEISNEPLRNYEGRQENIDILPRLLRKFEQRNAFEVHLQGYIAKNIGQSSNQSLDNPILHGTTLEWIGNEVSCGVAMQKIDILLSTIKNGQRTLVPIELKAVPAEEKNLNQLQRYIEWLRQYYIPNRPSDIQPVLLTKKSDSIADSFRDAIRRFNENNNHDCKELKFIVFDVQNGCLIFEEKTY